MSALARKTLGPYTEARIPRGLGPPSPRGWSCVWWLRCEIHFALTAIGTALRIVRSPESNRINHAALASRASRLLRVLGP